MNTAHIPYGQGIGFAVAVNSIKAAVEDILEHGRVIRPWLGVSTASLNEAIAEQLGVPTHEGAVIGRVVPGSPAAAAGLQEGDVITAINGARIEDSQALGRAIRQMKVGTSATLSIYRGRKPREVRVKLGEAPRPTAQP